MRAEKGKSRVEFFLSVESRESERKKKVDVDVAHSQKSKEPEEQRKEPDCSSSSTLGSFSQAPFAPLTESP